ncbi:RCC1 domain-containing protein [Nocardioides plantarum]|uniref:RCC1 domain-containing protein n=1 Tax=Nocardioides plantarum TaxID=29299 RepID=A0ABV5KAB1_9ACTN|nr:RCC1 domain-containing protein [Nocardioides plantarum]
MEQIWHHVRAWAVTAVLAAAVTFLAGTLVVTGPAPASYGAAPAGTPYAWGGNAFGELGDGTTTSHGVPGPVAGLTDVVDLHSGREHVAALRSDGTVVTWGSNQMGQLGSGTTGGNRTTPAPVAGLSDVTMVSTGHYQSLALRGDGSIWTWGYNFAGQLGDGTTTTRNRPVRVVGTRTYRYVAAGRDMSYAVATDGTVWAWGLNDVGQLGDGTTTNRSTPVRVGTLTDVVQVAGGRDHGLAVRADGSVWAWGWNAYGQVGDGTLGDRSSPVQVVAGSPAPAVGVAAGAHHSYALLADGRVLSWGRNYRNELGDGTTTQRTRPVPVLGLSGAVSIGSGRDHGLAALSDGTVRAWGDNSSGQLGDGTTTSRSSAVVVAGLTGVTRIAGGAELSVALSVAGGPPPPAGPTARFRATAGASANEATASVAVPASVQVGDVLVAFVSTGRLASVTAPVGWAALGSRTDGTDLRSWAFTRSADATTPGSTATFVLDAQSKVDLTLVAYQGSSVTATASAAEAGSGTGHDAPAVTVQTDGSLVLHHWVTKVNEQVVWSPPADLTSRRSANGGGSGQVSSLTADGGPSAVGPWSSRTASASVASAKAVGWTVVVAP